MALSGVGVFYVAMVLSIWLYQGSRKRAAAQMLRYIRDLKKSEEELKAPNKEIDIAMTAHAMRGDRERSLDAGMNDHLTKPINPAALSAILSRWMPAKP